MYSKKLEQTLKKAGVSQGDEISISVNGVDYSGILMPRPVGDEKNADIIILKLGTGYNIGISSEGAKIRLLKKYPHKKSKPADDERKKGGIAILGCGGTIASKIEYTTGAVYPAISPDELRAAFPTLDRLAVIYSRQLFSIFSEDMAPGHWKILAKEIEKEIRGGANGVVVMHGTDTMSYTSAEISFMLQNLPVPVVFVGSQRSSDRPSSENESNLLNAVFSARRDIGEVTVCMHADTNDNYCYLHRGTRVRKMHTSRRDAFHSINSSPIAKVDYGSSLFSPFIPFKKRSRLSELQFDARINPNVAMVYAHPGLKPEFIKKLDCYDGVVLIGTGLGHVPTNPFNSKECASVLPEIKDLISSGIPVVMAPQTINGRLNLKVYTTGRLLLEAGVIGHGADWNPEAAFVKLCWVLGKEKKMPKIQELMLANLVGEISDRSDLEVGKND